MLSFKKNNLLVILLLFVEVVFSQQFPSKNISTIDGLPNNGVYSVYKDTRGILWVGTANGLSAIQNGKISNFFVSDGLAHNSCWAIVEDENHNLWFGSHGGGLTFYDGKKFIIFNQKSGLVNDKVRRLFIYKNLLYIGTEFGVSVLDIKAKKIILSKKITGCRNLFQVMDFVEINSKIFFGTFNDGFWRIDLETKSIKLINHKQPDIFSIHKLKDSLFICHSDTINRAVSKISIKDYLSNKSVKTQFGSTVFWNYVTDKRNITYLAGNGINFATGGIFKTVKNQIKNINNEFGIESSEVWTLLYEDKRDILYVGTTNKGLFEIDLSEQIKYYPPSFYNKQKLNIVSVGRTLDKDLLLHKEGLLFLQHDKIWNEITNKRFYDFAKHSFKANSQLKDYEYFASFSKTNLEAFELRGLKTANSIIWINSTIGLFAVNNNGIIKEYFPFSPSAFDFENQNKIIFQVAYGRFNIVNNFRNNTVFKEYPASNLNNPKDAFVILPLQGKYYIASASGGLYVYKNDKFYSYFFNNVWKENELVQFKINYKNELVIANSFGDVFIIDVSKGFKIIKKINRKQLIGNSISFIECYKDILFIGTEKGLNIYKNGSIRLIDEEQGLIAKAFTSSNIKGTVLTIGTQNGYLNFDFKNYISLKNKPIVIKITAIDVNFETIGKSQFKWLNYDSDEIVLPYNKNTISIGFEPQITQYPNKLEYRYRLIGLPNSNWSKWTKDKNINLTYLPNGHFKLRLETKDLYLGTVFKNDILKIVITPPFWKTWLFLLSSFIFISIGTYQM
ncbi:MAG: two-component regulator propeller domain-containing protein, partial [Flavobacterium sp.]